MLQNGHPSVGVLCEKRRALRLAIEQVYADGFDMEGELANDGEDFPAVGRGGKRVHFQGLLLSRSVHVGPESPRKGFAAREKNDGVVVAVARPAHARDEAEGGATVIPVVVGAPLSARSARRRSPADRLANHPHRVVAKVDELHQPLQWLAGVSLQEPRPTLSPDASMLPSTACESSRARRRVGEAPARRSAYSVLASAAASVAGPPSSGTLLHWASMATVDDAGDGYMVAQCCVLAMEMTTDTTVISGERRAGARQLSVRPGLGMASGEERQCC